HGASVGNRRRWFFDDLYEQCSDHITAYIASSSSDGRRPSSPSMSPSSSSVSPSWRCKDSDGLTRRGYCARGRGRRLDFSKCDVAELGKERRRFGERGAVRNASQGAHGTAQASDDGRPHRGSGGEGVPRRARAAPPEAGPEAYG